MYTTCWYHLLFFHIFYLQIEASVILQSITKRKYKAIGRYKQIPLSPQPSFGLASEGELLTLPPTGVHRCLAAKPGQYSLGKQISILDAHWYVHSLSNWRQNYCFHPAQSTGPPSYSASLRREHACIYLSREEILVSIRKNTFVPGCPEDKHVISGHHRHSCGILTILRMS